MSDNRLKIGITQGDINGIGWEVILKSLSDSRMTELLTPVVYGSMQAAKAYMPLLEKQEDGFTLQFNVVASADDARRGKVNFVECGDATPKAGVASAEGGKAAVEALERAVTDLKDGAIDALVTAPIDKESAQSDTFHFTGHTEFFASHLEGEPMMIMCSDLLRVGLVTIHIPVAEVSKNISKEKILQSLTTLRSSLKQDFGIVEPRIAVLSLNPHAGENGLLGKEEQEIITPALVEGRDRKIQCYGPYAADGLFGSGLYSRFDGILAMYHDQGLAPFKTIAMETGVNYTAGLQYVRTSPDHGTGYDIAGKGVASEESMRQAIYHAIDVVRCRRNEAYIRRHPLRKQYFDRGKDNVVLDLTKDEHED